MSRPTIEELEAILNGSLAPDGGIAMTRAGSLTGAVEPSDADKSLVARIAALRAELDMMPSLAFAHDRRRKADEALDADDKAADAKLDTGDAT